MLSSLLLGTLLSSSPASAQDQPEFLLSDAGVRVELPDDWKRGPKWREGVVWSDWDLTIQSKSKGVMLVAWQTYGQVPIRQEELEDWVSVYKAKAAFMYLTDIEVHEQKVIDTRNGKAAWTRLSFKSEGIAENVKGTWVIATLQTGGQDFHLSMVTPLRGEKAEEELLETLDLLELVAPPEEVKWAPVRASQGVTLRLTDHWRFPLPSEEKYLVKPQVETLGMQMDEGLPECIKAVHPRVPYGDVTATKEDKMFVYESDFLINCQGGMLLGIVDPYTFEVTEEKVRHTIFGSKSDMAPASMLELPDRTAFLFEKDVGGGILLLLAVTPYDQGVARTYVLTRMDEKQRAIDDLTALLSQSDMGGDHPSSFGDWVKYYPTYRPLHPFVLGPVVLVLLVLGGAVFVMMRRGRKSYEDLD